MHLVTNEEHMAAFEEWMLLIRTRPILGTLEHDRLMELEAAIDAWEDANPPPRPSIT